MKRDITQNDPFYRARELSGINRIKEASCVKTQTRLLSASGRTMIETLGMLTIVGILSVGVFLLWNAALIKYKATDTINQLTQYVLLLDMQIMNNKTEPDLSEIGTTTRNGYPVQAYLLEDTRYFEIKLQNVPPKVCEKILKSDWKMPLVIHANTYAYRDNTGICYSSNESTLVDMTFQFYAGLEHDVTPFGMCRTTADCAGGCVVCQDGLCISTCADNERCAIDRDMQEYVCCPADRCAGSYCCRSVVNGLCCNGEGQCCPWHKPLTDVNGNCYACDYSQRVSVNGNEERCRVCPNREMSGDDCVLKCPSDKPLRIADGSCHACEEKTLFSFLWGNYAGAADCIKTCPNRFLNGYNNLICTYELCGAGEFENAPIMDQYGRCYTCDESAIIPFSDVTKSGCDRCKNRTAYMPGATGGGVCVLNCPQGQIRGADGKCYECEYSEPIDTAVYDGQYYCERVCPNRVSNGFRDKICSLPCRENEFIGADGKCYDCQVPETISVWYVHRDGCERCPNRTTYEEDWSSARCVLKCADNEFRGGDNICHSCDEPDTILIQTHGRHLCKVPCPNRVAVGYYFSWCALPCTGNHFTGSDGTCYPCGYDKNVELGSIDKAGVYNCDQCPDTRDQYNSYCVPKCSSDKPLRGWDNVCHACDEPDKIYLGNMTDACYTCAHNRQLEGNYCVLKP